MIEETETSTVGKRNTWITLSLFSFCIVASIGVILRSKILFPMPLLDYNRLLDAHFHFAFSGWATLALATLLVYDILPSAMHTRPIYTWLLSAILGGAWILLLSSPLPANSPLANFFSSAFILVTYAFGVVYIRDVIHAGVSGTVRLLTVFSLCCLMLSSLGVIALAYLFMSKSLDMFAYRDALYSYLHLMYNGFFSLAVFALLIHRIERLVSAETQQRIYRFSVWLCISIFPSLFLTYLWRDPNDLYRGIAVAGSLALLATAVALVRVYSGARAAISPRAATIRYMVYLALFAFLAKTVLQCFTIFPAVGNAVFGDRPVIIGFLHLVFLGFVSLFLLAYFTLTGSLDASRGFTRFALVVFTIAVLLNEAILMTQGLAGMMIKSSQVFPWLLWGLSILLFVGVLLVFIARLRTAASGRR